MSQEILDDESTKKQEIINTLYASFGRRVLASLIDGLVFLPLLYMSDYNFEYWKSFPLELFLSFLMPIGYKIIMEWKYGATIGKFLMKLSIVNKEFHLITWTQSIKRFSIYFLSYFFTLISTVFIFIHPDFYQLLGEGVELLHETDIYLICLTMMFVINLFTISFIFFTKKKQTLHDVIAQTYCVNKADWLNLQELEEILNR